MTPQGAVVTTTHEILAELIVLSGTLTRPTALHRYALLTTEKI